MKGLVKHQLWLLFLILLSFNCSRNTLFTDISKSNKDFCKSRKSAIDLVLKEQQEINREDFYWLKKNCNKVLSKLSEKLLIDNLTFESSFKIIDNYHFVSLTHSGVIWDDSHYLFYDYYSNTKTLKISEKRKKFVGYPRNCDIHLDIVKFFDENQILTEIDYNIPINGRTNNGSCVFTLYDAVIGKVESLAFKQL